MEDEKEQKLLDKATYKYKTTMVEDIRDILKAKEITFKDYITEVDVNQITTSQIENQKWNYLEVLKELKEESISRINSLADNDLCAMHFWQRVFDCTSKLIKLLEQVN